jgi:site-specific recombinase XerD
MTTTPTSLAPLLERFFTQRLMQQRQASPHTISSYRDTFRMLLKFTQERLHTPPAKLTFEVIDAPLIVAFLDHVEKHRGLSARSRNLRLTAIHSFFRYAAFESPAHAAQIQRVLAIPSKRFTRTQVHFLTRSEVEALLAAPDLHTWFGRRDHAFLLVAVQTGLRLSEMTGLTRDDVTFGTGAHVHVMGKGRKERCVPLAKSTVAVLKAWLREPPRGDGHPPQPRRRPLLVGPACHGRRQGLSGAQRETRHRPSLAPHHGSRPAARRRGSLRYCPVARARIRRNNADLSGGLIGDEGEGARENQTVERQIQTFSTRGPAPWLPQ